MMYKVEDVMNAMLEIGMISNEEYAEAICKQQFETISAVAEEYAENVMAEYIFLNLSGSIYEKEALQRLIEEYRRQIDDESEKIAHEIMVRSMRVFNIA